MPNITSVVSNSEGPPHLAISSTSPQGASIRPTNSEMSYAVRKAASVMKHTTIFTARETPLKLQKQNKTSVNTRTAAYYVVTPRMQVAPVRVRKDLPRECQGSPMQRKYKTNKRHTQSHGRTSASPHCNGPLPPLLKYSTTTLRTLLPASSPRPLKSLPHR